MTFNESPLHFRRGPPIRCQLNPFAHSIKSIGCQLIRVLIHRKCVEPHTPHDFSVPSCADHCPSGDMQMVHVHWKCVDSNAAPNAVQQPCGIPFYAILVRNLMHSSQPFELCGEHAALTLMQLMWRIGPLHQQIPWATPSWDTIAMMQLALTLPWAFRGIASQGAIYSIVL